MKKLIIVFVFSTLVFSCTYNQQIYSCDPEIDNIIKSAIQDYSLTTLTDLQEYDVDMQLAIYRTFSPDKKRLIWLEKFKIFLESSELSDLGKAHINKLVDYITPDFFYSSSDNSLEREKFEKEWIQFASNSLLWDNLRIYFLVNSLFLNEEEYSQVIEDWSNSVLLASSTGNCSCSTESIYCSGSVLSCRQGGCTEVSGCGFLFMYNCNGYCTSIE